MRSDVFASDRVGSTSTIIDDSEGLAAAVDEPVSGQAVAFGLGSVRIHLLKCACLESTMTEDVTAQLVGEDLHCALAGHVKRKNLVSTVTDIRSSEK